VQTKIISILVSLSLFVLLRHHVAAILRRAISLLVTELSITATLAMGIFARHSSRQHRLSAGSGVGLLGGIASVRVRA
jgi:ABC-type xylose transport system permease subunit